MNESKGTKKDNKLYWIIGGIAAFVLICGFLVVLVAGVGAYLYSATNNPQITKSEKKGESNDTNTRSSNDVPVGVPLPRNKEGEDFVESVKTEYSKLGTFQLIEAKQVKSRYFPNADFVVGAEFSETNSNSMVIHTFSRYKNWETAKAEAIKMMDEFKRNDPKLKPQISSKKVLSIVISGESLARFDCRERKGAGTCDFVASKDPSQLLRYIKLYFS